MPDSRISKVTSLALLVNDGVCSVSTTTCVQCRVACHVSEPTPASARIANILIGVLRTCPLHGGFRHSTKTTSAPPRAGNQKEGTTATNCRLCAKFQMTSCTQQTPTSQVNKVQMCLELLNFMSKFTLPFGSETLMCAKALNVCIYCKVCEKEIKGMFNGKELASRKLPKTLPTTRIMFAPDWIGQKRRTRRRKKSCI